MSLVSLLCVVIVVWLIFFVLGQLTGDPKLLSLIRIIVAIIVLLWLLEMLGLLNAGPVFTWRHH